MSILDKAKAAIEDRMTKYGDPTPMHVCQAAMWSAYLEGVANRDGELTPRDCALLMAVVKIAREACGGPLEDNLTDLAGYARVAELCTPERPPDQITTGSDGNKYEVRQGDGGMSSVTPVDLAEGMRACTYPSCHVPTLRRENAFDGFGNSYLEPRCAAHAKLP